MDCQDRFEVDAKFNFRYIATETSPQIAVVHVEALGEPNHGPQQGGDLQDDAEVGTNEIPAKVYASPAVIRQPPGVCDPDSDLQCSCPRRNFAGPPEQIPLTATKSNIPALEAWIRDYFKESAFNQCKR